MKKWISLLLVLIFALGLFGCGKETSALTPKDCVGTWVLDFEKCDPEHAIGMQTIELFEDGTGKGTHPLTDENLYYPLLWDVTDNVLTIRLKMDNQSWSFVLESEGLATTDGHNLYTKDAP